MPSTIDVDIRAVRSLVVVKPSSLGDVVHTLPAVHFIKAAHPEIEVRWVVNNEWAPIIEGNPDIHAPVLFPRSEMRGLRGTVKAIQFRRTLRQLPRPDLVIDFQGLLRSALIGRQLKAGKFIGMSDAREGALSFYSGVVDVTAGTHAVDRYLSVVRAIDVPCDPAAVAFPLPPGDPVEDAPATGTYVVLHPFARGQGKALSPNHVRLFCETIAPFPVVIVGNSPPGDTGGDRLPENVTDLSNRTTLAQLIFLMRHAAYNVSVDSGPMHIAAALGGRVLGIHTWTDPRQVGPYTPGAVVWKAGKIADRSQFSRAERETDAAVTRGDIQSVAEYVRAQAAEPPPTAADAETTGGGEDTVPSFDI